MSRFFATGSDSDSDTSSEEEIIQRPLAPVYTFSDDEEEVKRLVRWTKEKRYEELTKLIKQIRNFKKDMSSMLSSLSEDLQKAYVKALPVVQKEDSGQTPLLYTRYLVELEDFINEMWEDREGRKNLGPGLASMRQKLSRANPDMPDDDGQEEKHVVSITAARSRLINDSATVSFHTRFRMAQSHLTNGYTNGHIPDDIEDGSDFLFASESVDQCEKEEILTTKDLQEEGKLETYVISPKLNVKPVAVTSEPIQTKPVPYRIPIKHNRDIQKNEMREKLQATKHKLNRSLEEGELLSDDDKSPRKDNKYKKCKTEDVSRTKSKSTSPFANKVYTEETYKILTHDYSKVSNRTLSDYNLEILTKTLQANVYIEIEKFLTFTPFEFLVDIPSAVEKQTAGSSKPNKSHLTYKQSRSNKTPLNMLDNQLVKPADETAQSSLLENPETRKGPSKEFVQK